MSRLKGVELRGFWGAPVRRFESLDQTVAEFYQWDGVSIAAFYVWRKKLRDDAEENWGRNCATHHRHVRYQLRDRASCDSAQLPIRSFTVALQSPV